MSARVGLQLAASICGVKPRTIRQWTHDQRVTVERRWNAHWKRWENWYDVNELLTWVDSRNPDALYSRAGLRPADRPSDTRHVLAAGTPGLPVP